MATAEDTNGQQMPSMLKSHGDRAVTSFAANFEPQVAFAKKLPNIVENIMKRSKALQWGVADNKYIIREPNKKFFYHFDHQLFYCQTLGLDPWIAHLDDHFEVMSTALKKMDVMTRVTRLGFMVSIQLPLGMSHSEMCDLMFGSFLVDREELAPTYGKLDDLLLQLHGSYKEMTSQTSIAPQTTEQSRKTFLGTANLELFLEPKFLDTCVKEHYDRVSKECLYLRIEMNRVDSPVSQLRSFLDDSLEGAEKIVEGTVRRIRGLKSKGGESHGDTI